MARRRSELLDVAAPAVSLPASGIQRRPYHSPPSRGMEEVEQRVGLLVDFRASGNKAAEVSELRLAPR